LMATRFIFLTADGTVANEVTRRIGRQERKVQAPICIKRYNKGMQQWTGMTNCGRHFHSASRHGFKSITSKLFLGWWIWHWWMPTFTINWWIKRNARYGKIWLYGVVGECFDNDGLGKLCELSVESATTNLSGVTSKKINHFERTPVLVGKNPNKSNKWRTWVGNNWSGMCPIFGRRIYE
jgi:hypothetical protein